MEVQLPLSDSSLAPDFDTGARRKSVDGASVALLVLVLGVSLLVGLAISMAAAGVIFAIGFAALTGMRPAVALAFMLAASPFNHDLGGGPVKMAASEIALVLSFPVLVLTGRLRFVRSPIWLAIAAYLGVCLLSVAGARSSNAAVSSFLQMVVYMVVAVAVFAGAVRDENDILPALYALLACDLVLVLAQVALGSNYAIGLHKNAIGTQLSFGVVIAVGLWLGESDRRRRRRLALVAMALAGGLVLSLSRGAWVGAAGGVFMMLMLRREWKTGLGLLTVIVPVVAVVWVLLPSETRDYASDLGKDAYNIKARLKSIEFAWEQFKSSPLLGVGLGLRKGYDATNVVMSTLAETGVVGLATFAAIFVIFYLNVVKATARVSKDGPIFCLLVVSVGLVTVKLLHGLVDHFWSRGMVPVWAALGLGMFACRIARRRQVTETTGDL